MAAVRFPKPEVVLFQPKFIEIWHENRFTAWTDAATKPEAGSRFLTVYGRRHNFAADRPISTKFERQM